MTEWFDLYRDMNQRMVDAQRALRQSGETMRGTGAILADMQMALAQAAQANQAGWRAFLAIMGLGR